MVPKAFACCFMTPEKQGTHSQVKQPQGTANQQVKPALLKQL
jgi:hypothetical protein